MKQTSILLLALFSLTLSAAGLRQDFEDTAFFSKVSPNGYTARPAEGEGGQWNSFHQPDAVRLTDETAFSGKYSVRVARMENGQTPLAGSPSEPLPMPFTASMAFRRQNGSSFTVSLCARESAAKLHRAVMLHVADTGRVGVYDFEIKRYAPTAATAGADEWFQLIFTGADGKIAVQLSSGGQTEELGTYPANELNEFGLGRIELSAAPSTPGLATFFDDFIMQPGTAAPAMAVAEGGGSVRLMRAYLVGADGVKQEAGAVIDGDFGSHDGGIDVNGLPAELYVDLEQPMNIGVIRLRTGNGSYLGNPSGEISVKSYKIEILNNGYWHEVAKAEGQPDFMASGAASMEEYAFTHTFPAARAETIRITLLESNDTGNRASGGATLPPERRACYIREVEAATSENAAAGGRNVNTALRGDFELAVYRAQKRATARLTLREGNAPIPLKWRLRPELGDTTLLSGQADAHDNMYLISFDLDVLDTGRYVLEVTPQEGSSVGGLLHRMLRVDKLAPPAPPSAPVEATGCKLYPVDDYHFARREGVTVESASPAVYQATQPMGPDRGVQRSRGNAALNILKDGTFVIMFQEGTRGGNDMKTHFASSKDLKTWEVTDTRPADDGAVLKANRNAPSPLPALPPAAVPHWQTKTPFKDAVLRFHDAAKDGMPPLPEVRVHWFPPSIGDVARFGLTPYGLYPVWEKNAGEWIVLTREPLLVDRFSFPGDALETEIDGNDNFGPQFLTDDGKTLIVSKAAKLRRFPPYTIEYDNLAEAVRIMRTFSTHDGLHWERHYLSLPDESDPWSFQHYGVFSQRVDKDLYIGYLCAYECQKQQIYPEIIFSRDGLYWERLPGHKPFIPNTPPGTWLFGMNFLESNHFAHDGKYYLVLGSALRRQHFYNTYHDDISHITPHFLERSFSGRGLGKYWPYFKEIGGWEGLARDMHEANASVGLAEMRQDGWIVVRAGVSGGLLETRLVSAPNGRLTLNGKGRFSVQLLDNQGVVIKGYGWEDVVPCEGDDVAFPVRWRNKETLPAEPFRVRIQMIPGSEIYNIGF